MLIGRLSMTQGQFGVLLLATILCWDIGAGLARWVSGRSVYLLAGVAGSILVLWVDVEDAIGRGDNSNLPVDRPVAFAAGACFIVSLFVLVFWLRRTIRHHVSRG